MLIQIFFFDLSKRVRPEIHAIIRSEEELRRIFGEHLKQIKHELGRLNLKSPNDETTINILAMLREWNQGNLISLSSDLYVFLEQVGILKQDKERQAYRYGIYRFLVG